MPKRMRRIGRGDAGQFEIARHEVADLPCRERGPAAGEDIRRGGGLGPLPLPQGFGDIGGQIHDPIDMPFAVVDTHCALHQINGSPG